MKKRVTVFIVLYGGSGSNLFAGSGSAYDEMKFFLIIAGILLVLVAILDLVDYFRKIDNTFISKGQKWLRNRLNSYSAPVDDSYDESRDITYFN
ncbi:MAG TPA: hypothetical protein P5514_06470 [Bacteroidales bacterium]|nr:hypothetical protein [Bacteroidales bacterium]HRX96572.1 hypothetical protein [Bacteroidales bacterium]